MPQTEQIKKSLNAMSRILNEDRRLDYEDLDALRRLVRDARAEVEGLELSLAPEVTEEYEVAA